MDFTERIRSQHADARIVMSSDEPSTEVLTSNKMVITITALSLSSDAESQGMTNFDVESSVRFTAKTNQVSYSNY
jgi:hypothetical protein